MLSDRINCTILCVPRYDGALTWTLSCIIRLYLLRPLMNHDLDVVRSDSQELMHYKSR